MNCKVITSFNAYDITASTGQEIYIEDKGIRLDLEKLGWIVPVENASTKDVKKEKTNSAKTDRVRD